MMKEIPISIDKEGIEGPYVLTYTDKGHGGMGGYCPPANLAFYFDTEEDCREWVKLNESKFGLHPKIAMFPLRLP